MWQLLVLMIAAKPRFLKVYFSVTGVITRKGSVKEGNTLGDSSAEARQRQMSVEVSVASSDYEEIQFHFFRLSWINRICSRDL